jgi:hypothetical protein
MSLAIVFNNDASSTVEVFLTGLRDEEEKSHALTELMQIPSETAKEKIKSPFPP